MSALSCKSGGDALFVLRLAYLSSCFVSYLQEPNLSLETVLLRSAWILTAIYDHFIVARVSIYRIVNEDSNTTSLQLSIHMMFPVKSTDISIPREKREESGQAAAAILVKPTTRLKKK